MDLNALQSFVAVADAGSFSRAAETLFVSQPAVSKRVAGLEAELDTRLFDRIGRSIALTEAGDALLPHARRIVREVKESRQIVAALGGRIRGRLAIGTSHHIGLHRLPQVLRRFASRYPEVELDLHFMDSEQACEAVEQGHLELGVVTLPTRPAEALTTRTIWRDPLAIMVARDHPLCGLARPAPADLAGHPAILPGLGTFTRRIMDDVLRPHGLTLRVALETNYLETIKMLVSVGLGWSALPRSMLDADLQALPVPLTGLERSLGLVSHRRHTLTNAARAFAALLLAEGDTAENGPARRRPNTQRPLG